LTGRVYIASHSKEEANLLAPKLERQGFEVVSTWHTKEFWPTEDHTLKERFMIAEEDLAEVKDSDCLVLISGPDKYSGGKFIEAGIAYGMGKRVFVYGRRENMLTYLFPKLNPEDLI
jgi:nucleoside 2-deoxyribosyltransferase